MNNNVVRYKTFESFAMFANIRTFLDTYKDKIDVITTVAGDKYTTLYYQWKSEWNDENIKDKNFDL